MEASERQNSYKVVESRVKRIKNFYNHLQLFLLMLLFLFFFSNTIIEFFEARMSNANSLQGLKPYIWINASLWLFGIVIHGIYAYKYKMNFVTQWEKKKVAELMNKNT